MRKAVFFLGILLLVPFLLFPGSSFSGEKLFVLDLKVAHGVKNSLAKALSIVIRDEIHSFGTHEVLSREDIDAVAERATIEQLLGCDNDQCLIDLGQQVGTGYLVAGALSKLGDRYYFSLRLLDTDGKDTGVKKRVNWICPCDEGELIEAARELAGKLFDRRVAAQSPKVRGSPKPSPARSGQKTFTNSIGMKFVHIPSGSFIMGSPSKEPKRNSDERQHRVTISRPFYMQTTEVTQGQWKRVMGSNPSRFKGCGNDCPVEKVSWNDAQEFIRRLNSMEGTDKYRLPTEAQWEYACRAGTTTVYSWGESADCGKAMYENDVGSSEDKCVGYVRRRRLTPDSTAPVKSYEPNAWGLYDMHGNVWEWCADWYGEYSSEPVTDPGGPSSGRYRVIRGGGWYDFAWELRSADRDRYNPDNRFYGLGFRVLRDI